VEIASTIDAERTGEKRGRVGRNTGIARIEHTWGLNGRSPREIERTGEGRDPVVSTQAKARVDFTPYINQRVEFNAFPEKV
jgi:hypothetical protein